MTFSRLLKLLLILTLKSIEVVSEEKSFIASFQNDIKESFESTSDVWIEFSGKMPSFKEFTVCHWIKIRYFNVDVAACLWSYCTITENDLKCLRMCLRGIFNTQNRNLKIVGDIPLVESDFTLHASRDLKSYLHRTWTHLCWTYSSMTGENEFFQNGESLGQEFFNTSIGEWVVKGKDDSTDSSFVFGQEQDELGGGYEKYEAFIGDLTEFNLWNFTLEKSDIRKMSNCSKMLKGNVIDWNLSNLVFNKAVLSNLSDPKILCERPYEYAIFTEKLRYPEAKETCEVHGGILAIPKSKEQSEKLLKIVGEHKKTCLVDDVSKEAKAFWIGAAKIDHKWFEVPSTIYPPARLTYKNLLQNHSSPNSGCMYLRNDGAWVMGKYSCEIMSLCTICEIRKQPVFSWKGSCDKSAIDWNFYPIIDSTHQIKLYEGYRKTNIKFEEASYKWIMKRGSPSIRQSFVAEFSPNQFTTKHPVGRKKWLIQDQVCRTSSSDHSIAFSVCDAPYQFTCNSGECISIDKRCNEKKDCPDGSDEQLCKLISFPASYNKAKPPSPQIENRPLDIGIQTNIITIDSIDTVNMRVTLSVEVVFDWYDDRLLFENLFPGKENLLPLESIKLLWTPLNSVIHGNAIIGEITYDNELGIKVIPTKAKDVDASKATEDERYAKLVSLINQLPTLLLFR